MAKEEKAVNFGETEDFEVGGGLIQGELTWHNPRFEMFNYGGKGPSIPAFAVELEPEEGEEVTQYYSIGNSEDWSPSKDGKKIVKIGKADKLSSSSNFFQLIKSLKDAGWPKGKATDDVSVYDGMKCNMARVSQPERKGLQQAARKYEATILLVDKILILPWDKKGAKSTTKESNEDISEMATSTIIELLSESPDGYNKMKLTQAVFKKLQKDKVDQTKINRVVQMIGGKDESFLESGPWKFEDGKVSMG